MATQTTLPIAQLKAAIETQMTQLGIFLKQVEDIERGVVNAPDPNDPEHVAAVARQAGEIGAIRRWAVTYAGIRHISVEQAHEEITLKLRDKSFPEGFQLIRLISDDNDRLNKKMLPVHTREIIDGLGLEMPAFDAPAPVPEPISAPASRAMEGGDDLANAQPAGTDEVQATAETQQADRQQKAAVDASRLQAVMAATAEAREAVGAEVLTPQEGPKKPLYEVLLEAKAGKKEWFPVVGENGKHSIQILLPSGETMWYSNKKALERRGLLPADFHPDFPEPEATKPAVQAEPATAPTPAAAPTFAVGDTLRVDGDKLVKEKDAPDLSVATQTDPPAETQASPAEAEKPMTYDRLRFEENGTPVGMEILQDNYGGFKPDAIPADEMRAWSAALRLPESEPGKNDSLDLGRPVMTQRLTLNQIVGTYAALSVAAQDETLKPWQQMTLLLVKEDLVFRMAKLVDKMHAKLAPEHYERMNEVFAQDGYRFVPQGFGEKSKGVTISFPADLDGYLAERLEAERHRLAKEMGGKPELRYTAVKFSNIQQKSTQDGGMTK